MGLTPSVDIRVVKVKDDGETDIRMERSVTTAGSIGYRYQDILGDFLEDRVFKILWRGLFLSPDQNLYQAGVRSGSVVFYFNYSSSNPLSDDYMRKVEKDYYSLLPPQQPNNTTFVKVNEFGGNRYF